LNKPKYTNNQFVEKRKVALQLKREYETTGDIRTKKNFRKLFGDAELFLNENYEYMPCSKESVRFIMSLDIHKIILKRYNNLRVLLNIIQFIKGIHIIKPIIKNHNVCPFTLPILVNNRDKVQKELAEKGLYAPILWPIDNEAKAICEVSKSFSEKMLAIPVDQRYNSFNMAEIGAILKGVLNS